MKKLILVLMILGLAVPAFAERRGERGRGYGRGERHEFHEGYRGRGYYAHRDGFRRGYAYGHYYGRYGDRPRGVAFGYYNYPAVYAPRYYPYCDPAWGPCYNPPYVYRPGVAISVGVGWHRFSR